MKVKQTLTTEVVVFTQDQYKADLQVCLVDGQFSNLGYGVVYKNGKSLGLVNLIGGNSFELAEPNEQAKDFLLALRENFCNHYGIDLPSPADEMPTPPVNADQQEETITEKEVGNINEAI